MVAEQALHGVSVAVVDGQLHVYHGGYIYRRCDGRYGTAQVERRPVDGDDTWSPLTAAEVAAMDHRKNGYSPVIYEVWGW